MKTNVVVQHNMGIVDLKFITVLYKAEYYISLCTL